MSNANDFVIENGVLERYKGSEANVKIPDNITSIGYGAFSLAQGFLKEIIIPSSVKSIGKYAFSGCGSLERIVIEGEGLEELAEGCFSNCANLKNITLPDSVKEIESNIHWTKEGVFEGCSSLITQKGKYTFAGDILLKYAADESDTTIDIPEGVRFVMGDFLGMSGWGGGREKANNVKRVITHEGLIYIGGSAFYSLGNLQEISFPKSLKTLKNNALAFTSLKNCDLSNTSIMILESGLFTCCYELEEVKLPNSLHVIEDGAFHSCRKLATLELPDSVSALGSATEYHSDGVFSECGLKEIHIPEGVREIQPWTFYNCSLLKKVILPCSVTKIGESAFNGCDSLATIVIPGKIDCIGEDAFCYCSKLQRPQIDTVFFQDEAMWNRIGFGDENGCVVKDGVLEKYVGSRSRVFISEGVTVIPENVLSISSDSLIETERTYHLPDSLKKLEAQPYSFSYSDINIPKDYLRTSEKLPVKYTLELLKGPWAKKATLEDYAALFLYQSGKDLLRHCEEKLKESPDKSVTSMIMVTQKNGKSKHILKVAEFVIANSGSITDDNIRSLLEIAKEKKAPKAVALLSDLISSDDEDSSKNEQSGLNTNNVDKKTISELKKTFHLHLLNKTFAKFKGKPEVITEIKSIDGSPASDYIVKCAIVPYLDQYQGRPKKISGYSYDFIKVEIVELADRAAAFLDIASLQTALSKIFDESNPAWLIPLCRFGSSEQISDLISSMKAWKNWYTYSSAGRSNIIIARGAMMLNDTREAMIYFDKIGCLDDYAKIRGMDEDTFRDKYLSDVGLDEQGGKDYDLGNQTVTARLQKDMSFLVELPSGKTAKSLPKKGADAEKYEAAKKDFAEMKKSVKKILKNRGKVLFEDFLSGKKRSAEDWQGSYLRNPLLREAASLVVWAQGKQTFTLKDGAPVNSAEQPYTITDKPILVAHPMEMKEADTKAWQKYFTAHGLKQPFAQVWEPVRKADDIKEDRYKDCMIPYYRFLNQEKHGITVEDNDFHNEIDISIDECDTDIERIDWHRHEINPDNRFEVQTFKFKKYSRQVNHIVAYLDRVTVWDRVRKDDLSVMDMIDGFTLAQITDFIAAAQEANAVNVLAALMEYKNSNFADFDPMDEFTLEW